MQTPGEESPQGKELRTRVSWRRLNLLSLQAHRCGYGGRTTENAVGCEVGRGEEPGFWSVYNESHQKV